MKIAITGHSRGLGAQLKTYYETNGHEVSGFSRSNGYDLRDWSKMQKMLEQIADYDVFVNNAKPDFVQTTVLYELWKRWRDQQKIIINISSGIAGFPTCPKNLFDDPAMDAYRTAKVTLNQASAQLSFKSQWPRIIVVNPLHLYGNPPTQQELERVRVWVETFGHVLDTMDNNGFALKEITF